MNKYRKDLKIQKIIAWLFTLMLIIGFILFVVGLGIDSDITFSIGMSLFTVGLVSCPLSWLLGYHRTKSLSRLIYLIYNTQISTVNEISTQLKINKVLTRIKIDRCIKKQYLPGYKRDGDIIKGRITSVNYENKSSNLIDVECTHCGAKFQYNSNEIAHCPYCGSIISAK